MIPKVIHYCWFGGNPKSELITKCIESWKTFCPEYEIIEWNEKNFDINSIQYIKDAYAAKKWAFVSDFARLDIIYNYGGIYLDTDVLLRQSLDSLLKYDCWLASDDVRFIATGLGFGAQKGNPIIKALRDGYYGYTYPSGTNVLLDTKILEVLLPDWRKSNKEQVIDEHNLLLIGVNDYGKYAQHLYTYTWADEETAKKRQEDISQKIGKKSSLKQRIKWKIKCLFRSPKAIKFFDKRKGSKLEKIYTFIAYDLLDAGLWYFVKRFVRKIKNLKKPS